MPTETGSAGLELQEAFDKTKLLWIFILLHNLSVSKQNHHIMFSTVLFDVVVRLDYNSFYFKSIIFNHCIPDFSFLFH